jgi:ABC-type transport system involved in cytochrome bd biosynthesis fused ATPase/permease subunit
MQKIDLLSPQGIAFVTVLFAAIILSHLFAPLAVGVITSMASTLMGAVLLERKPKAPTDSEEHPQ